MSTFSSVRHTDLSAFDRTDISSATLHVPAASVEQYQTTEPWSGFGTIVALTDEDNANAIEDVKTSEVKTEIARYDIHGRQISTPQNRRSTNVKGINIIRNSDGTTKKKYWLGKSQSPSTT